MSDIAKPAPKSQGLLKKFGILGFLFFLCKGLLWLALPVALAMMQ